MLKHQIIQYVLKSALFVGFKSISSGNRDTPFYRKYYFPRKSVSEKIFSGFRKSKIGIFYRGNITPLYTTRCPGPLPPLYKGMGYIHNTICTHPQGGEVFPLCNIVYSYTGFLPFIHSLFPFYALSPFTISLNTNLVQFHFSYFSA